MSNVIPFERRNQRGLWELQDRINGTSSQVNEINLGMVLPILIKHPLSRRVRLEVFARVQWWKLKRWFRGRVQ